MNTNSLLNTEIITSQPTEFQRLSDLRQKVLDGVEIPPEEYAQVIESLRRSRTAVPAGKTPKGKANVVTAGPLQSSDRTKKLDALLGDDD